MRNHSRAAVARMLLVMLALAASSTPLCAADWQVAKSSGEVWIATPNAQPASLGAEAVLRAGDKIQTGRNGRVLLVRGAEAIMIAPNSVVALPTEPKSEHATTLLHQAGSIVLEVEKRDVNHFEIETPYLAAVVKGTRFAVTVSRHGANVRVTTGKVHVSDFKTGQSALVLAGQAAHVPSLGKGGLTLEGAGQLGPVQPGIPRKSHLERVPVPAKGLGAPRAASTAPTQPGAAASDGRVRIVAPIGRANLDIAALTKGLARGPQSVSPSGAKARGMSTIWSNDASGSGRAANANGNGNGNANGGGGGNADGNANGKGAGNGKAKGKNK